MSGKWILLLASNFNHHLILYLDSAFILVAHFVPIIQRSFIIFKAILYWEVFTELLVCEDARTTFLSHFGNTDFKSFRCSLYLKDPHFTTCSVGNACLFHWKKWKPSAGNALNFLPPNPHPVSACMLPFFLPRTGHLFIYLFGLGF